MDPKKRRMVAYIAGRLILNKESTAVYDHATKKWFNAAGACKRDKIEVFDYERQCYMVGVIQNGRMSIFDNGSQKFVELKLKGGKKFEGFDYESGKHFGGEADPKAVALYDFQDKKYYHYVV
jgi:hypothetical protein